MICIPCTRWWKNKKISYALCCNRYHVETLIIVAFEHNIYAASSLIVSKLIWRWPFFLHMDIIQAHFVKVANTLCWFTVLGSLYFIRQVINWPYMRLSPTCFLYSTFIILPEAVCNSWKKRSMKFCLSQICLEHLYNLLEY